MSKIGLRHLRAACGLGMPGKAEDMAERLLQHALVAASRGETSIRVRVPDVRFGLELLQAIAAICQPPPGAGVYQEDGTVVVLYWSDTPAGPGFEVPNWFTAPKPTLIANEDGVHPLV